MLRKPCKPRQNQNKKQSGGLGQQKQDNPSLAKSPAKKGEAKAVEEQDRPLLTTSPANIQDNNKMHDGAHTTTALLQGSEFVPSIEHIAPFISIFKNNFQNAASEDEKNNLCWQVLALLRCWKSPLPFVNNALNFIRNNLEKEKESVSIIAKHGEKDVPRGKGQRKCILYLGRTLDFKNQYLSATNWTEKYEMVVHTIYNTLITEGF